MRLIAIAAADFGLFSFGFLSQLIFLNWPRIKSESNEKRLRTSREIYKWNQTDRADLQVHTRQSDSRVKEVKKRVKDHEYNL